MCRGCCDLLGQHEFVAIQHRLQKCGLAGTVLAEEHQSELLSIEVLVKFPDIAE